MFINNYFIFAQFVILKGSRHGSFSNTMPRSFQDDNIADISMFKLTGCNPSPDCNGILFLNGFVKRRWRKRYSGKREIAP